MDVVNKFRVYTAYTSLLLSCFVPIMPCFAAQHDALTPHHGRYVLSVDLGSAYTTPRGNSLSFPLGYSTFTYESVQNTSNPIRLGLAVRKRFAWRTLDELQLGLSYHYLSKAFVYGELAQGIAPPFAQFNYGYNLISSQLSLEAKLIRHGYKQLYPYVIASIGTAWNRAFNYTTSIPQFLTLTPYYQNKERNAFTYTVGAGIDIYQSKRFTIGLGYRFTDLGAVGLGNGHIANRELPSYLNLTTVYVNTVLAEVHYFL